MANITFSEGSGLNDSIYGKSQAPIRMMIESKAEAFEEKSIVEKVFMKDESKNYAEKYTSLTAMDGFKPVGENGANPIDGMQEGYPKVLEHVRWADSFSISREMIEDSKQLDLKKRPDGFIKGFYRTRENFGAALFGAALGQNSSTVFEGKSFDATTADGLTLFHNAHTSKINATTQSNVFANAFSADALAAAEEKMQNFMGDNDNLLNVVPNTIIIPNQYALKKAVFAAIGADKDPATANNGFNFLFGRWNVIVWPYLNKYIATGTAPWILADLEYNEESGGAILTDRTPLDINSYMDNNTWANVWAGFSRFTAGFSDWRAFAAGGVTGGDTLIG